MAKEGGGETVNQGQAPKSSKDEEAAEYEIAENVREHGEDPSPDDRERGERTRADRGSPVDIDRS